jgi:chromosome segregation protein
MVETQDGLASELQNLVGEIERLETERAHLPDISATKVQLETARLLLKTTQGEAADSEAARRQMQREEELRYERLIGLQVDERRWLQRMQGARARIADLVTRRAEAVAELQELAERPAQLEAARNNLLSELTDAEAVRHERADILAAAEGHLYEYEKALKQAEAALSAEREARARLEAEAQGLTQNEQALLERITEKCECAPDALFVLAELEAGVPLPEPEAIEARLAKLLREREALGPVNLRAEQEVEELQAQIDNTIYEKDELVSAIAKFRGAIGSISREARERLLAAFSEVNGHFERLFTRLFGGGTAALKLTEAEDPLEAGLEVVAQPPGKKLQNLTLLSGGEQALASMALIFAVFLTNPSPICVLDEVDAPLDEANIDRFCNLLEDMGKEGKTRFLVITHQRLTMSRMHRLYGVTMAERGISQLVSVNLEAAAAMRDAA